MPPTPITLEPVKDLILNLYSENTPVKDIISLLKHDFNIKVGKSTLYARLKFWGVSFNQIRVDDTPELRERIHFTTSIPAQRMLSSFSSSNVRISQSPRLLLQEFDVNSAFPVGFRMKS